MYTPIWVRELRACLESLIPIKRQYNEITDGVELTHQSLNVDNTLEEPRRCRVTASEHGSRLWIRRASLQSPLVLSYMVTTTNLTTTYSMSPSLPHHSFFELSSTSVRTGASPSLPCARPACRIIPWFGFHLALRSTLAISMSGPETQLPRTCCSWTIAMWKS